MTGDEEPLLVHSYRQFGMHAARRCSAGMASDFAEDAHKLV